MKRRLWTMSLLGVLLLFSSLAAYKALQEERIEISTEQKRYVLDDENPLVFSISAYPRCAVCVEVTNDNDRFSGDKSRTAKNFFSSFFGSGSVEGVVIYADEEGNAEYTLPMGPLRNLTSGPTKLYYRAFVIDSASSDRGQRQLNILASSLEDRDFQEAPYLEVFPSAEEEEESALKDEANVPFQKGVELYEQKDYEGAIEEFLKAKEIVDRGNIECWLSLSYLQLACECAKRGLAHPTTDEKNREVMKYVLKVLEQVLH